MRSYKLLGKMSLNVWHTLLWDNEHVAISIGKAAVVHRDAGGVHMDGKAIFLASTASATNGGEPPNKVNRV